jgi:hypothetical protein
MLVLVALAALAKSTACSLCAYSNSTREWPPIDFNNCLLLNQIVHSSIAYSRPADRITGRAGGAMRRFHYLSGCQEREAQTKGVN